MADIRIFDHLLSEIPFRKILRRLGYSERRTEIEEGELNKITRWIEETADIVSLRAVCFRSGISMSCDGSSRIVLEDCGEILSSMKLGELLKDSDQIIMMGVTGGREVAETIAGLQAGGKMTEAVVVDAAASEIVDEGFSRLAGIYERELVREGRRLTARRFSAGYGDFEIEQQKIIHRILDMKKIDVRITDSCILIPEKSVTAVYGILRPAG